MAGETTAGGDARLLAGDLARVCGVLAEVATAWRREWQSRPELPVGLPARLENAAGQLTADVLQLADADPAPDLGFVVSRLEALRDEIAAARAITCSPGMPPAGDAALWDTIDAAMSRAGSRLAG